MEKRQGHHGCSHYLLLPRLQSPSVQVRHTHLTPCVVVCRCSQRSQLRSTSTRAPWTASRRSRQKKAWLQVCSKDLLRTSSAALAEHSCLCCTIVPKSTLAFKQPPLLSAQ